MPDSPIAYFITFRTYGTWLHGDNRGSTNRNHNLAGTPHLPENRSLWAYRNGLQRQDEFLLSPVARAVVESTIREVCLHREWILHAVNAREIHVHVVVEGTLKPERAIVDFKAWSTRRLNEQGEVTVGRNVWSRHGSTRYLWNLASVDSTCHYVLHMQD